MCVQKSNLGIVAKKRWSLGKTDEASQGICLESRNKNGCGLAHQPGLQNQKRDKGWGKIGKKETRKGAGTRGSHKRLC